MNLECEICDRRHILKKKKEEVEKVVLLTTKSVRLALQEVLQ